MASVIFSVLLLICLHGIRASSSDYDIAPCDVNQFCPNNTLCRTDSCVCDKSFILATSSCTICPGYDEECHYCCYRSSDYVCFKTECYCIIYETHIKCSLETSSGFALISKVALGVAMMLAISALAFLCYKICAWRAGRLWLSRDRPGSGTSLTSVQRFVLERLRHRPPRYEDTRHLKLEKPPSYLDSVANVGQNNIVTWDFGPSHYSSSAFNNPAFMPDMDSTSLELHQIQEDEMQITVIEKKSTVTFKTVTDKANPITSSDSSLMPSYCTAHLRTCADHREKNTTSEVPDTGNHCTISQTREENSQDLINFGMTSTPEITNDGIFSISRPNTTDIQSTGVTHASSDTNPNKDDINVNGMESKECNEICSADCNRCMNLNSACTLNKQQCSCSNDDSLLDIKQPNGISKLMKGLHQSDDNNDYPRTEPDGKSEKQDTPSPSTQGSRGAIPKLYVPKIKSSTHRSLTKLKKLGKMNAARDRRMDNVNYRTDDKASNNSELKLESSEGIKLLDDGATELHL